MPVTTDPDPCPGRDTYVHCPTTTPADVDRILANAAAEAWDGVEVYRCHCRISAIVVHSACGHAVAVMGPATPEDGPSCCDEWTTLVIHEAQASLTGVHPN